MVVRRRRLARRGRPLSGLSVVSCRPSVAVADGVRVAVNISRSWRPRTSGRVTFQDPWACYLKAEAAWSLNSWDGGRESWLKDLDRLGNIGSGLVRTLAREPGTAYSDFNATIREMREMLRERRNFRIDGRRMLPDVVVRWKASVQRLNSLRARLRKSASPAKSDVFDGRAAIGSVVAGHIGSPAAKSSGSVASARLAVSKGELHRRSRCHTCREQPAALIPGGLRLK